MDFIQADGIFAEGFGFIAKSVMKNRELSIYSKVIYSYICSYSGAGKTAFPSRDKICFDLGIGKDSFHKHMKPLVDEGFIVIEKVRQQGSFANNLYKVISLPCPPSAYTVASDTVSSDTTTEDTNINSLKKNNTNIRKKTTTTEQKISSSSSMEFLEKEKFEKINFPTKKNIRKEFPDLTEEKLESIYTVLLKQESEGKIKSFNAVLIKALRGEWSLEESKAEKGIVVDKSKDRAIVKNRLSNVLDELELGYCTIPEAFVKFEKESESVKLRSPEIFQEYVTLFWKLANEIDEKRRA